MPLHSSFTIFDKNKNKNCFLTCSWCSKGIQNKNLDKWLGRLGSWGSGGDKESGNGAWEQSEGEHNGGVRVKGSGEDN